MQINSFIEMTHINTIKRSLIVPLVAVLFMVFTLPTEAKGQNKKALLVGISNYPSAHENAWDSIHGTNDIRLIAGTLKTIGFSVTEICDNRATCESIKKSLSTLTSNCQIGDTVYIHFSCHGQPFEDFDGDEDDGWDESIVPYDAQMRYAKGVYEGEHHITDDMLSIYFSNIRKAVGPTGFVFVVIDACHAGGSSRGEEDEESFYRGTQSSFTPNGKTYRPRINTQGNFHVKSMKGMSQIIILEACRAYQTNCEILQDGSYYGPLSYYISKVMDTPSYNISNMQWVNEVKKMMEGDSRLIRQNMVYETSIR